VAWPWALALALQARMGWPLPGTDAAWHPRRVLRLLVALALELALVRRAPLGLRIWRARRCRPPAERDLPFGSQGLSVDLVRAPLAEAAPVVLFVYGGAWGQGSRTLYTLLAERVAALGALVVVPDYTLWPRGDAARMVADLDEAMDWVAAHAAAHGGDPRRVVLMGHSAGAHLLLLWLLRHPARAAAVQAFVGLAGPYDIGVHFRHEQQRGVESLSPMHRVMGHTQAAFEACSPAWLVAQPEVQVPALPYLLLHGEADGTVPCASTLQLGAALAGRGAHVTTQTLPGVGHSQLVVDWMQPGPATDALEAVLRRALARPGPADPR
jgi:acetyl esterase/lipase